MKNRHLLILFGSLLIAFNANAQCDSIADYCEKHITDAYISDGQEYRALLIGDEMAEFRVTLYGESTYRLAACSFLSDGNLIFSLFDQERNLLFTNLDQGAAPYWDFKTTATIEVIIEAQLNQTVLNKPSGCAVLLLGFKQ